MTADAPQTELDALIEALGAERVLNPVGSLPQAAERLDASASLKPYEVEIDVDRLCLDSTSFRQLEESNSGDRSAMAKAILSIVEARGKMHNPVTGSGGIMTGTVSAVGGRYPDPPSVGTRVVSLASLTLTPLRLGSVPEVETGSSHVGVRGTAYLPWTVPLAPCPEGASLDAVLAALDVCNAATQTRELIGPQTNTVLVLGGGHAGLLAMAAARDSLPPSRTVVLMDAVQSVCDRARLLGLCDHAIVTDLRDPVSSLEALLGAGVPRADLTVVVVNASDCEASALLLTADTGAVLYFSMATSFTKAALGSEGMASTARMVIGSGYASDRGEYALELVTRNSSLAAAMSATNQR